MAKKQSTWFWILATIGVVVAAAVILFLMGREPWCSCGTISLWHGNIWSSQNSQQLSDWYTFSHIIHGFIFYWFFTKIAKKWKLEKRLLAATVVESAWEILENSPLIINRYRATTASLDYFGDSIINSTSDSVFCIFGFLLAYRLPVYVSVTLVILMEIVCLFIIRDNLTLNIIMLIYPLKVIKDWQLELAPH